MCARYELGENPHYLLDRFGLTAPYQSINMSVIRPTDQAMIIGMDKRTMLLSWGFQVEWDKKPLINARSETLTEKPTFKPHLENRCLVPATSYFEWRNENGTKRKNSIRPSDQVVFAMAGLVSGNTFTIITCLPAPEIAHIHGRMPVILAPEDENTWLDPSQDFVSVAPSLTAYNKASLNFAEDELEAPRQGDLFG